MEKSIVLILFSLNDIDKRGKIMKLYKHLSLLFELIYGGLVRDPLEILSLCDREKEIYPIVKNKPKSELTDFIKDYIIDNNLNRKSVILLEKSEGIRYMISEGFHDALLINLTVTLSQMMLYIDTDGTFCTPKFEADISQVIFKEAKFDRDRYDRLYNNLEKKLLYVRQNFELIDDKIITKLTFCPNSVLMEHPLSIESKDIIITPYSK